MGLTQIFLIIMVASIVLAVAFCIASVSMSDSESAFASVALAILAAIFAAAALGGLTGSIWSYNINLRDSVNRCTESGGYVETIDERRVCIEEYPVIKWKV